MAFSRKLWKWSAGIFAALIISCGLLIGFSRLLLAHVPDYRVQIQAWLEQHAGVVVDTNRLDTRWRFYGPELVFEHLSVRRKNADQPLLTARRGAIGLDLWTLIGTGRWRAGRFLLEAPVVAVQR